LAEVARYECYDGCDMGLLRCKVVVCSRYSPPRPAPAFFLIRGSISIPGMAGLAGRSRAGWIFLRATALRSPLQRLGLVEKCEHERVHRGDLPRGAAHIYRPFDLCRGHERLGRERHDHLLRLWVREPPLPRPSRLGRNCSDRVNECTVCPSGRYRSLAKGKNEDSCSLCPVGRYVNTTASTKVTDCLRCPAGEWKRHEFVCAVK
jgi:hypothetical protein